MKSTFISKENNDVKFEIEISAEEFETAQIEVYKRSKEKYNVDGFRKGKAPRKLIEQHFGEGVFWEDAVEDLLGKNYPAALTELDIEPIDRPAVEFGELAKGKGFTVTISVATPPEIEVKDYTGVKISDVSYEVTDEDILHELETAQERNSRLVDVDRAAEDGDTVNIDYSGFLGDVQFDGGTAEGHNLKLGSGQFIPGFEEQLVGKSKGEETDVNVTFPEEYQAEDLAGQQVVFHVKINSVKAEEKPEINDEFAQDISEFETLAELKADIENKLSESNAQRAESEKKNAVLEAVYAANEFDIPAVMIEDQMDEMVNEFAQSLRQQGLELEQYFTYLGREPKEFRESLREEAEKRVKMRLIVKAVAKAEGFDSSDEELETELTQMSEQYSVEPDKLRELLGDGQLGLLKDDIRNRKAVDYMFETAIVE